MKAKVVIISFFIVSLFLSVFIQTSILINYVVNQEAYIEEFCVNKDIPDSHCKGSCHLSQELKTTNTDLPNQSEESLLGVVSIFSFQQIYNLKQPLLLAVEFKPNYKREVLYEDYYIHSIFRPPTA